MRIPREDIRVPDAEADLYLIGLGIGGFDTRTVEVDELLKGSAATFHLTAFDSDLRRICGGEVIDLKSIYESDDDPRAVYRSMSNAVVDRSMNQAGSGAVLFLTYGHPLFLVDSGWQLLHEAASIGIRVKAVAASSFIDQVLVDVRRRYDLAVQSYESHFFIRHEVVIDARMPLLLSQVGDFGSLTLRPSGRVLERLEPLLARIASIYPADRECCLIFSSWRPDVAPESLWTSVGELSTIVSSVHVGCSLYVRGLFDAPR
ncbi:MULTISPECIES: SAM-dependent methyltransferase [unclassified Frondihabitans]|uniref:SAM-dependent methyltransferase n=1 Tax=unclassified Frondihabitans TaxID=2626248 RepID=UPI000F4D8C49|nr:MULTISPECIES: SAM-dependent methyltransferase [unclassified Frondihabitans]RPE77416.1 tetrapyrrole (corrin/porphyrin) methylase-like protein [Frondihabitans sp. PhB153]RPF07692.1 tetrapyrrole (corrin/porphyrin) methylase-like protein [Frondihabitans sp. PhB161]